MTREEAEQILIHYDDLVWQQDNHITCGMISEALNLATDALSEPTQEEFIDKAVNWMKENYRDFWGYVEYNDDPTEMFDLFREAMTEKED